MDLADEIGIDPNVRAAITISLLMVSILPGNAQRRGPFIPSSPYISRPAAQPASRPSDASRNSSAPGWHQQCDGPTHNEWHEHSQDGNRGIGVVAVPVYVGVDAGLQPMPEVEASAQSAIAAQAPPMAPVPPAYPPPTAAPRQDIRRAPPAPPDPPYVLIALKNGWVYPAIAYWVEARTLHFLTFEMEHRQVQLDLINRKISAQLNQNSEIEFKLPPE